MRVASAYLRLSALRALVGQISPRLYGVCVDERDDQIILSFYIAPEVSDDERDDLTAAGGMVIGDYADDYELDERFIVVDDKSEPLKGHGTWVLLQRGFLTVDA